MADPTVFGASAEVGAYISGYTNNLENATTLIVKELFDTPDLLFPLINNAAYFGATNVTGQKSGSGYFDVSNMLQELIWANALPIAWCKEGNASARIPRVSH